MASCLGAPGFKPASDLADRGGGWEEGLSRKGSSLPTSRPRARETRRRRRRPAPRDPAGPAPSTAAHSALPGASPGSPASYFHRTGLLSTHFIIPFQVDPNLQRAPSPSSTRPPPTMRPPKAQALRNTSQSLSLEVDPVIPPSRSPRFVVSPPHPPTATSFPVPLPSCSPPLPFPLICLFLAIGVLFFMSVCHTAIPPTPLKDSLPGPPPRQQPKRQNKIHTRQTQGQKLTCFQPAAKSRLT
ncbi:vegetative cell wall protein gp1-like isoform X1 [Bubalus bubalis]|uniref:vegetative cell wall protein gp1-like isoform X1 n=1 Tax=Bubalus bubalis TaxID=89462 RepID=UPI001E1B8DF7|nr:vegetative cell wall protein gp1-like isoform X1 [Bubalus bubalis]